MDCDPAILQRLRQQNAQLLKHNGELTATVAKLIDQIDQLRHEIRLLRAQLDPAQTVAARQAAPFRRDERLKKPPDQHKKPGRAVGHPGAHRRVPPVDHHQVVPLPCCPKCGGAIHDVHQVEQIPEEIPPAKPVVCKIITYRDTCRRCGEVCSRHPLQTSDATGAAGVHLGPRAIALAAALNKHHGLTMRRTCKVLLRFRLRRRPSPLRAYSKTRASPPRRQSWCRAHAGSVCG